MITYGNFFTIINHFSEYTMLYQTKHSLVHILYIKMVYLSSISIKNLYC